MRREGIPLYGLESGDPISDFDIIGFSLGYEMAYSNVLNMLDLAGLPLRSADRDEDAPLIIAGGVVLIILAVWFMSRLKRSWRRSSPRYAKPFCDPCFCW